MISEFIIAACVPVHDGHSSGTLEEAERLRRDHPEVATATIQTAVILGDEPTVRRFIAQDPASATTKGGPHGWDPLTYLCFSKYLRLDPGRSDGFVRAARALLEAGASATTGFDMPDHQPEPGFESVLYGAAGVAHHAELTRLLLEHGADPNDGEVAYHAPEGDSNAAMRVLVESGKLTPDTLTTMLVRKADWHDREGIELLLQAGADPNRLTHWGFTALHQALRRDNDLSHIELMLDHGADPLLPTRTRAGEASAPQTAAAIAAHRGRGDVLASFLRRGLSLGWRGVDRLIAACAMDDAATIETLRKNEPRLVEELIGHGGKLLFQFAGVGNTAGVRHLLDLGVDVEARCEEGDGYFGLAKRSTALHAAAWRVRPSTVQLLIESGASVDAPDAQGRTPLVLAVRGCIDSFWTDRRSPEPVRVLLAAGASLRGVPYPCGYPAVDEILRTHVQ